MSTSLIQFCILTIFLSEGGPNVGLNTRCTKYSFASRRDLFNLGTNFLIVPGDNEWNECYGYDESSNTDPVKEMWRKHFAAERSPFNKFSKDFPGGGRPAIYRHDDNPEIFYFNHNRVAFFGLNQVDRSDTAPVDANEEWVKDRLSLDTNCELESIVILSQTWPKRSLYDTIDLYFDVCESTLPILTVTGNTHPKTYCMATNENEDSSGTARVKVTAAVVRDPNGGDFFHVEDTQGMDSNRYCPTF